MTSSNMAFAHADVKTTKFTWKIDNYSSLSSSISTGSKLDSSTFTVKPDDGMKWQMSAWPNGYNSSSSTHLSITLNCLNSNGFNARSVNIALSAMNKAGCKYFEDKRQTSNGERVDFFLFIPTKFLTFKDDSILQNDVLTLCCELTAVYKDLPNSNETIEQSPVDLSNKILNAFEQQLEYQEFSDVKLVASCGKELLAHKFVLAARSPVFLAMFRNDMREKNNNSVAIQDLDYDSIKEMLRFMYSGKVENVDKVAEGVLAAQEKYQIEGLKELYEYHFFQNINVENAIKTLIFSIRFNLDKIKLLAKKFIRCHAKDVSNSAAFKAIDEPNLLTEIVNILAET